MKYQLLKEVLELLEKYEDQEKNISLKGFTIFLNQRQSLLPDANDINPSFKDSIMNGMSKYQMGFENHITYLVGMMWKYAKHYVKEGFKELSIKGIDDFGFLASLSERESLTKTELITHNVVEIPSGMEIIKRLLKLGYIESFDDLNDRRAKRIKITPLGRKTSFLAIQQLMQIAKIVVGDLTLEERVTLLALLEKLHYFHQDIHQNDWKSDLPTIIKKYLEGQSENS